MSKQQRLGLVAAAVAVAIAAFVVARPGDDEKTAAPAVTGGGATAAPAPAPQVTRIAVRGGRPVGGAPEITLKKGDTIRVDVSADARQEVHLHGYDVTRVARPGSPARFRVPARIDGVFALELEGPGVPIARLRVEP